MTAEVAIANANAVAIAADSAVTVGQQKIYNSALKVFSLSKIAPVGIMVYGNAGFLGTPWETLIKVYRTRLGHERYDSIEEYADDFLRFLTTATKLFPDDAVSNWVRANAGGYLVHMRTEIREEVQSLLKKQGQIDEEETRTIVSNVIRQQHDQLKEMKRLKGMTVSLEKRFKQQHRSIMKAVVAETFQGLVPKGRRQVSMLYDIICFLHTRDIFSTASSGVVVAGFGDAENFPSIVTCEVEEIVERKLKCRRVPRKCLRISGGNQCGIIPFAQEDMVATFMQGMNPAVSEFVHHYLSQLMSRLPDLLPDKALSGPDRSKQSTKRALGRDANKLLDDFLEQLKLHSQSEHIDPILEMVSVLPKDELAAMAESLVNLTAFKRRLTQTLETVGGPIDVAVISKGDGLVWVKRKHYFPRDLNQHFFANYFRNLGGNDGTTGNK